MAKLELRDVRKSFKGTEIVRGVNIDIADGEFVVFVGPSGCGKSTLLRMIAGLEEISSGELHIGNDKVNTWQPAKRGVAMVFQGYALYPHMTVYDNMAFGLGIDKEDKTEIRTRVTRAAEVLQLDKLLERKPRDLSGGQRQRVAIGRAIVRKPRVFLFDEPLSNLDASLRVQMRIEFANLHRQLKTTMVYVTHDQVEAMTLADKIVVLNRGQVEQMGPPLELYHHPRNIFVAGFIGSPSMNFIDARVVQADAQAVTVELPGSKRIRLSVDGRQAKAGDAVTLGIRPEHFTLAEPGQELVSGEIKVLEQLGDQDCAYLVIPGTRDPLLIATFDAPSRLRQGSTLLLGALPELCHLFDAAGLAFVKTNVTADQQAHATH